MIKNPSHGFSVGLLWGCGIGSIVGCVLFYTLSTASISPISLEQLSSITEMLNWIGNNMGSSLYPFLMVITLHIWGVFKLQNNLNNPNVSVETISQIEHWLEILESLSFGIGVLWTAIGMRSALLNALGGYGVGSQSLNASASAILERLVEGGILVALSTTIVGGIAGYLLRLFRIFKVGFSLRCFYESREQKLSNDVLVALGKIEKAVSLNMDGKENVGKTL